MRAGRGRLSGCIGQRYYMRGDGGGGGGGLSSRSGVVVGLRINVKMTFTRN